MLDYNDNVHIYPEKNCSVIMIIDVHQYSAFFCRWWRRRWYPYYNPYCRSCIRYRQPAPDSYGSRTDSQLSIICWRLNLPLNLALTLTHPSSSKKMKTDMKLPKCQCTAEQYHLFDISCFVCVKTPLTSV